MQHLLAVPVVPAFASLLALAPVQAQSFDRDGYLPLLAPMPPIVGQSEASRRLGLYGDSAHPQYRDLDPVDGIDDVRARRLLQIAERFTPILRRNNFSAPRDFRVVLGGRPVIEVDTWMAGRRVRTDSIPMVATAGADGHDDAQLAALVREFHPLRGQPRIIRPQHDEEKVLFIDFPGEDAATWRAAYRDAGDSHLYAHAFIHEDSAFPDAPYTFVVQYWLFYPFNDASNNHEGDWEHISVLITLNGGGAPAAASGRLREADVQRILDERDDAVLDSLAIRAVEYYFHDSIVILDYLAAGQEEPATKWQELRHLHVWESPHYVADAIRLRRTAGGGRFATHPIGFVSGNSKGPDELMHLWPRFQGSFNRNGHGTYPFPGTWRRIGPLQASEQMFGPIVPELKNGWESLPRSASLKGWIADDDFVAWDASDITLIPDWERVERLVLESPQARSDWSWLLLPIRWGFPVAASPGAGAIRRTDLGHVAAASPAFQPTWNRLAAETGRRIYQPRALRVLLVPLSPWDRLANGWGFLNIPVALLGFLPGWNVVLAHAGPWLSLPLEAVGAAPSKTFVPGESTDRFTSLGLGWHVQIGGSHFGRLLPEPDDSAFTAFAFAAAGDPRPDPTSYQRSDATGFRVRVNLHYGARFSVQNTYARNRSRIQYSIIDRDSTRLGSVHGTLALQEITGGFRHVATSLFRESVQLFVGGGWGWTWYDVNDVSLGGQSLGFEREGGYGLTLLPSLRWWPNSWYGAAGVEWLAPHGAWVFGRFGYGVQAEFTGLLHRLGATRPGRPILGTATRREFSIAGVLSW